MKKNMYCLLVTVLMLSATYAQETSLTIDCQTPGWLSSKITYPQQQTLENLKVSGYINGTDIKFIRELNKSLKLHGVIDLGDANIVSGGESYYTYNTTNYTTKTNEITGYMFAQLDSIQKVVLPHSTISFSGSYQFLNTYVDTLVINGTMENLSVADGYNNIFWKTRCIYFPEGLKTLNLNYLFHSYSKLTNQELFFPSTIETFTGNNAATSDKNIIFHCESTTPENIEVIGYTNNNFSFFDGGTIYVPKGTKSSYEKSVFRKLTIIEDISVDSIKCESATLSTYVGEEFECKATLCPSDAIYKNIEYEVSDSALLNIIGNGYFLSKAYGTGYIYAYSHNREFVDSCEVRIYNHTTGLDIDKSSANVKIGGTIQLIASTLPEQTSDNRVTYSSTDNNTAIVNEEGTVYGLKPGICVIKAKSVDGGYTAECVVTVEQPVGTVELNEHNISLNVGEVKQLSAMVLPTNADNKSLVWSSSNSEVVTVDENGEIEALQAGNAYIKVVSVDNPSALDSCIVSVVQPTTGITLSHVNHTLNTIGESVQLTAFVSPENATNKNVKWASSNESICIVNNGLVIGVGEGTAVIIATTEDGGHMATCVITVKNKEYLLTYVLDGKVYYTESLAEGEVITPLEEPTKEGYTFSGWSEIPGTMPANDVTISGTFSINKYLVTFKISGVVIAADLLEYGAVVVTPEAPEKEGYTFNGWDEVIETVPANDVTIEGSYSVNSYLLTYTVDGDIVQSDSVVYGTTITLLDEPIKEGYTFSGWREVPNTMPANEVTISGTFTINKYLVTFKIDDEIIAADSLEYGVVIVAPEAPEKEGYTFNGWDEVIETVPANDVTIEGSYSVNFYLLAYMVDGEIVKADSIAYGTVITLLDEPTKEGHTFSGWSEAPETMPASDVTISGTFTINQYTITYIIDGEVFATDTINYGEAITVPDVPVKEGYDFAWSDEIPETMPAKDIVINGSYTTGILNALIEEDVLYIYTTDGQQVNVLQKGINIVLLKDGSIRKLFHK